MSKLVRSVCGMVLAASMASPALAVVPGKVLATATVDGFTVNLLRFPTVARLKRPTSTTGTVTMGVNAQGSNPYAGSPLDGSPFLSVNGGTATFALKQPVAWVALIWGTPDNYNTVSLYDTSGNLIGSVYGGDIVNAFGFANGLYLQILSTTPIGAAVAGSDQC